MRRLFLFLHTAVVLGAARSAISALVDLAGSKQTMFGPHSVYAHGAFDRSLRDVHTAAQHAVASART
jgi:hypothetical protein